MNFSLLMDKIKNRRKSSNRREVSKMHNEIFYNVKMINDTNILDDINKYINLKVAENKYVLPITLDINRAFSYFDSLITKGELEVDTSTRLYNVADCSRLPFCVYDPNNDKIFLKKSMINTAIPVTKNLTEYMYTKGYSGSFYYINRGSSFKEIHKSPWQIYDELMENDNREYYIRVTYDFIKDNMPTLYNLIIDARVNADTELSKTLSTYIQKGDVKIVN